ncbi:phytoene synthase [Deinobacterium chartae]|uniref:Phytoene synthase n=1 Tax=Deinobacterium chartae TaxID=521158 RepID=A0A841HZX3_9DEIO|nr:phytoene/squalene synthase family protein [Deinobacterium chartae]MBB6098493.1 phytoene synthase [Deinobacterium chartae]
MQRFLVAPDSDLPQAALERCRRLTRQHSQTFYFGSRFFSPVQRRAVWAVYAVCRTGDDIADEPGDPLRKAEHLEAWREGVEAALQGCPPADLVYQALAWAASRFALPSRAFHELYQGLRMDLEGYTYRSAADLELYCRRVAGVVGWMIAPICGYEGDEQTLQQALRLGMAMQLTNVLRDVGEDLGRGRIYLPAESMARHGVTCDDLRAGRVSPEYRALMTELVAQARAWYREGRAGIPRLHDGRMAVAVAARAYEGILDSLERNGFDNFNRRAFVPRVQKIALIPRAWRDLRSGQGA